VTYTPATGYSGTDSFTFKVNDGSLDSAVATVSIGVSSVNSAPVANAQSVSTPQDTAKLITLTGSDANGDALTYTVLTQPAKGSLTGSAPNLTYTPGANTNGGDSFTFQVNDGAVDSAPATVSITIVPVNQAPTASAQSVTTAEDTAKAITLSGGDVEGSPLSYSIVTQPAHGTLSGTAPNVTYTPSANYSGADNFTFSVNDGSVDSAPATVSITVTAISTNQFSVTANSPVLNPQTGLHVQQVNVTNTGSATVAAVRLTVRGLRPGVTLQNASGNNAGWPSVRYDSSLNAGAGVTFVLEYYVPDRMPFTSTLEADAVLPSSNNTSSGGAVSVDHSFLDRSDPANPRFTIEFATVPGRSYTIIYTDDLVNWKAATPGITASASITQWHDDGPPKTVSKPGGGSRFYRVIAGQ
jgi:hypothetical protein